MTFRYQRDWDSTEWETYALRLVQLRHGAHNVQTVPDNVRGDAGIEFLTTDGCCYQCYAPAQSSDTAKAASAMKQKATRDLRKLKKNMNVVEDLLRPKKMSRWILLCPFLDDKSVISHIRNKSDSLSIPSISFVTDDFDVLIQSQIDFETEITTLRSRSLGIPLDIESPSYEDIARVFQKSGSQIIDKLARGFPHLYENVRTTRANYYIRAHITSADTLDQLRLEYPESWELYRQMVNVEEIRLQTIGSGSGNAAALLTGELKRLESKLSNVLQSLHPNSITTLATGIVATWLIECPLDFHRVS